MSRFKKDAFDKAPFRVSIAKYGCEHCGRRWQSANGSIGDFQLCKKCYEKCYPREIKIQAPNKKGNQNRETYLAHNTELCGKCIRLGYSCIEAMKNDGEEAGIVVSTGEGEEITLGRSDLSSFIVIQDKAEKKKKKDKSSFSNNNKKADDKKAQKENEKLEWIKLMDEERSTKNSDEKKKEPATLTVAEDIAKLKVSAQRKELEQHDIEKAEKRGKDDVLVISAEDKSSEPQGKGDLKKENIKDEDAMQDEIFKENNIDNEEIAVTSSNEEYSNDKKEETKNNDGADGAALINDNEEKVGGETPKN